MVKTGLGFSDLALIFKVTVEINRSNLNRIDLVCRIYGWEMQHFIGVCNDWEDNNYFI